MPHLLALQSLTAERLAPPLATLIAAAPGRPATIAPGPLAHAEIPGAFGLTVLQRQPADLAATEIRALERHPWSAQSFLPIRSARWLLLLAPSHDDGSPDVEHAVGFLAGPDQAVCIARNVWHAGLTVFDQPAEIAMLMWKSDSGDDGVLHQLDRPISLVG